MCDDETDGGFDAILKGIAEDIMGDDKIEDLGFALGFRLGKIHKFLETNRMYGKVTCRGTLGMLREWYGTVNPALARGILREALAKAKLIRILETCLSDEPEASASASHPSSLAQEQHNQYQPPARSELYVTDAQLLRLASLVEHNFYTPLANALEVGYAVSENIKRKNLLDMRDSTLEMLQLWNARTGGLVSELDAALIAAQCRILISQYKEA